MDKVGEMSVGDWGGGSMWLAEFESVFGWWSSLHCPWDNNVCGFLAWEKRWLMTETYGMEIVARRELNETQTLVLFFWTETKPKTSWLPWIWTGMETLKVEKVTTGSKPVQ